jgi:hypothetical protein
VRRQVITGRDGDNREKRKWKASTWLLFTRPLPAG